MTYRIVPVEPTEDQKDEAYAVAKGRFSEPSPSEYYAAMLSAAEPFEWPEEAVEAAARAYWVHPPFPGQRSFDDLESAFRSEMRVGMEAALNAALKVVEGRE